MKISAVIPCYGAPQSISELHARLIHTFKTMNCQYEIILVNDSCPKGSWTQIEKICQKDSNVIGVNFVRNFGQHTAISAGLDHATGDWTVVMDCDLQDDPTYIPEFLKAAADKYEVVLAKRVQRQERPLKRLQSWTFYRSLSLFLGVSMNHQIGNFGLYSRRTIEATKLIKDRTRFFPFLISFLKFPTTTVDITQNSREEGQSSYTFAKALSLAFQVAISSSNRPLLWSVQLGAVSSLLSFAIALVFIARYFLLGLAPSGWTSLIVSIFFSTGLILFNIGILGLYLAQLLDQAKEGPKYVIKEILNR